MSEDYSKISDEWKKFKNALAVLEQLRTYPNGKNLPLRESKFLNYFGKVAGMLNDVWDDFYYGNECQKIEALEAIVSILNSIEEALRKIDSIKTFSEKYQKILRRGEKEAEKHE
jgi:hypothetical protein